MGLPPGSNLYIHVFLNDVADIVVQGFVISGVLPHTTQLWENRQETGVITTQQARCHGPRPLKHVTHTFLLGLGILATFGEAARVFPSKL